MKFRRAYIIHTVSSYKENTTVINKRTAIQLLTEFTEVTRKKEEEKNPKKQATLMARTSPYRKSSYVLCQL